MKKKISLILTILLAVCFFTACNPNTPRLAATADEEYARISNLSGEGVIYDFTNIYKLQVKQNLTATSPEILAALDNSVITETLTYQIDRSDNRGTQSYYKAVRLNVMSLTNSDINNRVQYSTDESAYKFNRTNNGQYYNTYEKYLNTRSSSGEYKLQTAIKLFDKDKLSDISGSHSFGVYTINATVPQDNLREFYEWYQSFFPFVRYTSLSIPNFFDPNRISEASLTIKTNAIQLLEVNAIIKIGRQNYPDQTIDLNGKCEFAINNFEMEVPVQKPENW